MNQLFQFIVDQWIVYQDIFITQYMIIKMLLVIHQHNEHRKLLCNLHNEGRLQSLSYFVYYNSPINIASLEH
jgi:hypothetical protein